MTTRDNEPPSAKSRTLDFTAHCPDCHVAVGEPHSRGCDLARCLKTGLQRCADERDCGRDVWTGWWPGLLDCEQLGWMIGPGLPDLNRLYTEATWNAERCAWVKST